MDEAGTRMGIQAVIVLVHIFNWNSAWTVIDDVWQCTFFFSLPSSVDPNDQKKTACYDIDVEVDDTLKTQMNSFLLSTASQQEIAGLDNKVQTLVCFNYFELFDWSGGSVSLIYLNCHYSLEHLCCLNEKYFINTRREIQ